MDYRGIQYYHGPWRYHGRTPRDDGWGSPRNRIITEEIAAARVSLQRQGVQITQWGPDAASGKIMVYLTRYSRAAVSILHHRYGNSIIVWPKSVPRPGRAYDRDHDTTPWDGGDYITGVKGQVECTSGPTVINGSNGNTEMLTAGHCFGAVGNGVYNDGNKMGSVLQRRFGNYDQDAETVSGNYADEVWGGAVGDTSPPSYIEDGAEYPLAGDGVTADGAFTGEIRDIPVVAVNQDVTFDDGITTVYLTEAGVPDGDSGPVICHDGDSGGPWFVHEDGSSLVKIAGTYVGCSANNATAWYQEILHEESYFNVSVP